MTGTCTSGKPTAINDGWNTIGGRGMSISTNEPKRLLPHEGPPYIGIAVFCEQALEEKDGIFSLVRMFNEINVALPPETPMPSAETPLQVQLLLFVLLYEADQIEWKRLAINIIDTHGSFVPTDSMVSNPLPEKSHLAVRAHLNLPLRSEGKHWAEIVFNDRLLSRVPLNVLVARTLE